MKKKWISIILSSLGDKQTPNLIIRDIQNIFCEKIEIFIPKFYKKHDKYEKQKNLFNGYIFVNIDIDSNIFKNIGKINNHQHFDGVLKRGKSFAYITQKEIDKMKNQLNNLIRSEFKNGDEVEIYDSIFDKLRGIVIDVLDQNSISLQIKDLKSREVIINLPHYCLKKIE